MLSREFERRSLFELELTRPIARLVHVAVALRCAEQEVDPRFSRLAALALVNQMDAQAVWEWKPELSRPYRKRYSLGGGQKKKNEEVNSPTPDNQRAGGPWFLSGNHGPSSL
jgi:hypothetical protein